jgi:hypothetical protein
MAYPLQTAVTISHPASDKERSWKEGLLSVIDGGSPRDIEDKEPTRV